MRFRIGLRTRVAGPGEVVEVAPGVVEAMLAKVVAMARAGRLARRGLPRSPLGFARLARTYDRVAHAPLLSLRGQRLLLAPLVLSARHPRAGLVAAAVAAVGLGALG